MAINPAAYEPWKRRRLAAGMPLSAIEAMRPKPVQNNYSASFDYPKPKMREGLESIGPVGDAGASMGLVTNPAGGSMGEMLPGMQSQELSGLSASAMGFARPKSFIEGTLDQVRGGKPPSPFESTPGIFQGGGPPVAPGGPAVPGASPSIPPGALANGFDPRFKNAPKVPLWR